jgi:hypothetical protein
MEMEMKAYGKERRVTCSYVKSCYQRKKGRKAGRQVNSMY